MVRPAKTRASTAHRRPQVPSGRRQSRGDRCRGQCSRKEVQRAQCRYLIRDRASSTCVGARDPPKPSASSSRRTRGDALPTQKSPPPRVMQGAGMLRSQPRWVGACATRVHVASSLQPWRATVDTPNRNYQTAVAWDVATDRQPRPGGVQFLSQTWTHSGTGPSHPSNRVRDERTMQEEGTTTRSSAQSGARRGQVNKSAGFVR
jgi:hypothetical protein